VQSERTGEEVDSIESTDTLESFTEGKDDKQILLSVVITMVGGNVFTQRCLDRLISQIRGRSIEVIVPYDSTATEMASLQQQFPQAIFVDMGVVDTSAPSGTQAAAHELYDCRTAAGLNAARGKILALLQDYGAPAADWCDQVLQAHDLPYGVIGGAVEHEGQGALNWGVYFLDFGRYQPPLPEQATTYLTDINVSYKREVLESVKELWKDRYKEVTVNWALSKHGVVLWQRPQIIVYQDRGQLSFFDLVIERYSWGRLFGSIRTHEIPWLLRLAYIVGSPAIPIVLLVRMARKVFRGRRSRLHFLRYLPQTLAMTVTWCFGEFIGYVTGRESSI